MIQDHCNKIFGIARNHFFVLLSVAAIFFVAYQFLYGVTALRDIKNRESTYIISNQPDEASNYFFIRELVFQDNVGRNVAYQEYGDDQLHPRSMTVVRDTLVPIGFPFYIMIIAGAVSVFGILGGTSWFNLFAISITPLVAVVTAFAVYALVRRLSSERVAFISSLVLFVLPPWWYYASRPFQHTILFFALVIFSLYGLVRWKESARRKQLFFAAFSGLMLASALAIRPSELVWVVALYGLLFYLLQIRMRLHSAVTWFSVVGVVGVVFLYINYLWYGHPFASGYVKPLSSGEASSVLAGGQGVSFLRAFLFPFGIDIVTAVKTAYKYLVRLFIPFALVTVMSVVYAWIAKEKKLRTYILVYAALSGYLILSYGSWNFTDNLLRLPSIGSSQTRYLMPIYLGAIPLVAYLISSLLCRVKSTLRPYMIGVIGLVLCGAGLQSAVFSFPEGLNRIRVTLDQYRSYQAHIDELLASNAVVVTRYGDKYVFPDREVIIRSPEENRWIEAIHNLLTMGTRVYWHDVSFSEQEYANVAVLLGKYEIELGTVLSQWDGLELREMRLKNTDDSRIIEE